MVWLYMICALSVITAIALALKCIIDNKALHEISAQLEAKLNQDTNTLLSVSSQAPAIRRLAKVLNAQLRLLRSERRRYQSGDRELKEAITHIAHDLRTPLTALSGYMELMEKETLPPDARRYAAIMVNRIDALKRLTEELFRYTLINTAQMYTEKSDVIINHQLEQSIAALYGAMKEKGIAPVINIPAHKIKRRLNQQALERILENILVNAIRYSDGDLSITLDASGEITIANHAAELDSVSLARLFDRFYTVENGKGGTGLGLSIAKALTEQMGGTISAEKEKALFRVRLFFSDKAIDS